MLPLRADKWVRVGCGFVLLLLLAAQEQFCPWLSHPEQPRKQAEPTDGTPPRPDKRPKRDVPFVLRDAPRPTDPAASAQSALRQSIGVRDGVVSCGPRNTSAGANASPLVCDALADWHSLQLPFEAGSAIDPDCGQLPPPHPAVRTCISPTGPPCV